MPSIASSAEERDARRRVRADTERRRAARALDRYIELVYAGGSDRKITDVAGERLVEAVGDYVLARLGNEVIVQSHHNGDYGVVDPDPTGALADMCSQLPGCRPGTDGEHSASCEVSIYRDQQCTCDEPSGLSGCEQHMPVGGGS